MFEYNGEDPKTETAFRKHLNKSLIVEACKNGVYIKTVDVNRRPALARELSWPDSFIWKVKDLWYWEDETRCLSEKGYTQRRYALDALLDYANNL